LDRINKIYKMGKAGKFLDGIYGRKKLTEFLKGNFGWD
jgi:hypothetical protein